MTIFAHFIPFPGTMRKRRACKADLFHWFYFFCRSPRLFFPACCVRNSGLVQFFPCHYVTHQFAHVAQTSTAHCSTVHCPNDRPASTRTVIHEKHVRSILHVLEHAAPQHPSAVLESPRTLHVTTAGPLGGQMKSDNQSNKSIKYIEILAPDETWRSTTTAFD